MKNGNAPTSDSYQDYLILRLADPHYAAVYLETHLEDDDAEPDLLQLALSNVCEALSHSKLSPEAAKLHQQKLHELLTEPGSQSIYDLARWLEALGLKLTITVPTQLTPTNSEANRSISL